MKTVTVTCDSCEKEIPANSIGRIEVSERQPEAFVTSHFCGNACLERWAMRDYRARKVADFIEVMKER